MVLCQCCTTRNPMTLQFCWKCGTKLMLTAPSAPDDVPIRFMDENVLERVGAVEYALSALNRRIDALTEAVERVAASNFVDHAMIETLTESMESAGVSLDRLEDTWRERVLSRLDESDDCRRLGDRIEEVVRFYRGAHRDRFTVLMQQAYEAIVSDRSSEGMGLLNTAYEEDPANFELGMLLAEVSFDLGDLVVTSRCLSRVLEARPDYFEATLLKGMAEERRGRREEAQRLLEGAVRLRDHSPSAHAVLGWLLAQAGDLERALAHLKRALQLKPTSLAHFVLGTTYDRDGRYRQAVHHLKQATALDPGFDEAFYQLGLSCMKLNWIRKAEEYFRNAQMLNPRQDRYRRKTSGDSEVPAALDQLNGMILEELQLTLLTTNGRSGDSG